MLPRMAKLALAVSTVLSRKFTVPSNLLLTPGRSNRYLHRAILQLILHPAEVGLRDGEIDIEPVQLLDTDQGRPLIGDDHVSGINQAFPGPAVDRRSDRTIAQVDPGLFQLGPSQVPLGDRAGYIGRHGVEILLGNQFFLQ